MLTAPITLASHKPGVVYDLSVYDLWTRASILFGKSTGEERMTPTTKLKELHLKDDDYLTYQSIFNQIIDRLHTIGETSFNNLVHDLFFIGL